MKKVLLGLAVLTLACASLVFRSPASAQSDAGDNTTTISTTLVLSQVDGGGGGSTGTYLYDYVEIKNISNSVQSLNGLSLFYGSATGNFSNVVALPNASIVPGQYYLVQLGTAGSGGQPLPVPPDYSNTNIFMSGSNGKIALAPAGASISGCGSAAVPCTPAQLAEITDWVAYGAAGNGTAGNGEGGTSVNNGVALVSTQGGVRKTQGCTETDNNNNDFDVVTNPVPRNTSSPVVPCGGGGGTLQAAGAANPSSVAPGNFTLLTVTVVPAPSPPSTGITVNTDLSTIGGSNNQTFYDDGTHGDLTPGDNVFSYLEQVPSTASGGVRNLPSTVADAQGRTAPANISLTITGPVDPGEQMALGNPSNATTDINFPLNYLLVKTQYVMSYNRDRGEPNWVAWHLDTTWLGSVDRQNDFRPDTSLPAGWYQVQDTDYSGSGFDRGHHCPSGDRTNSVANNSATFLMTNMMPQAPNNNQGAWADLENYCRSLAQAGNELYIYAGGAGIGGQGSNGGTTNTIANGHVTVPAKTWKVILVLPNGDNDVDRVTKGTRIISVIMPNSQSVVIGTPWRNFRTNVKQIEGLTGLNFFTNVRPIVRQILKLKKDTL